MEWWCFKFTAYSDIPAYVDTTDRPPIDKSLSTRLSFTRTLRFGDFSAALTWSFFLIPPICTTALPACPWNTARPAPYSFGSSTCPCLWGYRWSLQRTCWSISSATSYCRLLASAAHCPCSSCGCAFSTLPFGFPFWSCSWLATLSSSIRSFIGLGQPFRICKASSVRYFV